MGKLKWFVGIIVALFGIYLLGPAPESPVYLKNMPGVPSNPLALQSFIAQKESRHKLKKDNEARIVWADDSSKNQTDYAIVYLHGFSASYAEGEPVHRNIAKKFGCNLYLSRLAEHGIDTVDRMVNLTADKYWESAKEALAIGKQLGKKVILMGTSTGGTNALQLAANYPDEVAAIVLMSPNIRIFDKNAWILNNHWGLSIAKMINGSNYIGTDKKPEPEKQYWNSPYRIEAAVALEEMLETSMTPETFSKINQPTLLLYYYRDEIQQDSVVQVSAMKEMFSQISTPTNQKRAIPMPKAGDHVIGSYLRSKDIEGVEREIESFLKEVVGLNR